MKRVSVKMLILLLAVSGFAAVCYCAAWAPAARADTHWWCDNPDPNQSPDPNQPADPNASAKPLPEMGFSGGSLLWLTAMPADVNEPNQPPASLPEKV